jgi:hypothetical protein
MPPKQPQDTDGEPLTEVVTLKMTATMKRRLIHAVNRRRLTDQSLSLQLGLSEYIRDLIAAHLEALPDAD